MNLNTARPLQLIILKGHPSNSNHRRLYHAAFSCWKSVWTTVHERFNLSLPVSSDPFTRQDEIACIFKGESCIGMTLYRIVDFSTFPFEHDSYFKDWSPADIQALTQHGSRIFIASYLTVMPEFRAFSEDIRFKQVFMNLMIKRFLMSPADTIAMATRRERDINGESQKVGSTLIRENVPFFGGKDFVDLVSVYRKDAHLDGQTSALQGFCSELWENRIDFGIWGDADEVRRKSA